jgi:hypothetical protein
MTNYFGDFSNWAEVQINFDTDTPEPDEVFYAWYDVDGYDGRAVVLYRTGSKFYYVDGSHCSCYGLEDQWEPEEYDAKTFIEMLRKGEKWLFDGYLNKDEKEKIIQSVIASELLPSYTNGHA